MVIEVQHQILLISLVCACVCVVYQCTAGVSDDALSMGKRRTSNVDDVGSIGSGAAWKTNKLTKLDRE